MGLDIQVEVDLHTGKLVSLGNRREQVPLPAPLNTTTSGRRSVRLSLKTIATPITSKLFFIFFKCSGNVLFSVIILFGSLELISQNVVRLTLIFFALS